MFKNITDERNAEIDVHSCYHPMSEAGLGHREGHPRCELRKAMSRHGSMRKEKLRY